MNMSPSGFFLKEFLVRSLILKAGWEKREKTTEEKLWGVGK